MTPPQLKVTLEVGWLQSKGWSNQYLSKDGWKTKIRLADLLKEYAAEQGQTSSISDVIQVPKPKRAAQTAEEWEKYLPLTGDIIAVLRPDFSVIGIPAKKDFIAKLIDGFVARDAASREQAPRDERLKLAAKQLRAANEEIATLRTDCIRLSGKEQATPAPVRMEDWVVTDGYGNPDPKGEFLTHRSQVKGAASPAPTPDMWNCPIHGEAARTFCKAVKCPGLTECVAESPVPSEAAPPKCREYAGDLIAGASWFACALPKGHEPSTHPDAINGHIRGGDCFAHGEYIGAQCPHWPKCINELLTPKPEAAQPSEAVSPTRLIKAVKELLSWVPVCSVGSSGHLLRIEVEEALKQFGEDGSLKSVVGVEADLKHPHKDTGGEIADSRRWMKLPYNPNHPDFNEVHREDSWCAKAGCVLVEAVSQLATNERYTTLPLNDDDDYPNSPETIAAVAYQICGTLNAPARILDYFSEVSSGRRPKNPLPFSGEAVSSTASPEEKR
jgi:hypothetical protein